MSRNPDVYNQKQEHRRKNKNKTHEKKLKQNQVFCSNYQKQVNIDAEIRILPSRERGQNPIKDILEFSKQKTEGKKNAPFGNPREEN